MAKKRDRNVFMLGWVSFLTDISSEMIFPVLPIFLTTVLNANMAIVGTIEGIAESTASILKLFSGWLSDRIGKRKLLAFSGYALSSVTKPLLALATSWWHVLFVRVADRVGKGIRDAPRDVIIANSVGKSRRGRFFGIHRMMDTMGAVCGALIASLLLYFLSGKSSTFRIIFLISAVPGILALIVLGLKVKDIENPTRKAESKKLSLRVKGFSKRYKRFLLAFSVFSLAQFTYAFFILRAKDVGVSVALLPVLYLVFNLVYAVFAMPAGKISDIIGRKKVLAAGYFLFGAIGLGFAFWADSRSVWVLFALYGLFMAITDGVSRAYVSDLAPEKRRGTAMGVYHTISGISDLPANLIGGFLWAFLGAPAAFIYMAVLSAVSAAMLFGLVNEK